MLEVIDENIRMASMTYCCLFWLDLRKFQKFEYNFFAAEILQKH